MKILKLFIGFLLITWVFGCQKSSTDSEISIPSTPIESIMTTPLDETTMTITIHFNSMGGTVIESIDTTMLSSINEPNPPIKEGYQFFGWYTDEIIAVEQKMTDILPVSWPLSTEDLNQDIELYALFIDYKEYDEWVFTQIDDGYSATSYLGDAAHIEIPRLYKGVPIIELGYNLFENSLTLESIVIPKYVTTILDKAFEDALNLSFVIFEEDSQLEMIHESAFHGTLSLKSITIPHTVISINDYAFRRSGLENILFEEESSLTELGVGVFYMAKQLQSITIPKSVHTIEHSVFYDAISLTSITFESGISLQVIPSNFLYNAELLAEIIIPKSVISIGIQAFEEASHLSSVIFEEDSQLEMIHESAFHGTLSLKSITIPHTVISINDYAFRRSGLENILFEEESSLTELGVGVFYMANLSTITIPLSVTSVGSMAFYENDQSLIIYCMHTNQPSNWHTNWNPNLYQVIWLGS
ncbi:MAG: leucine-rich repeat protein [Acholeplasmataceae bacterium]|jgi:hypothetical protein|nr:leucine-rich repeat protein [Acholeplasmataceae bacterium]